MHPIDYQRARQRYRSIFPNRWGVACAGVGDVQGCLQWLDEGGDIHLADSEGNTCLHHALYVLDERFALMLLDRGFTRTYAQGRISLGDARRSGHFTDAHKTLYQLARYLDMEAVAARLKAIDPTCAIETEVRPVRKGYYLEQMAIGLSKAFGISALRVDAKTPLEWLESWIATQRQHFARLDWHVDELNQRLPYAYWFVRMLNHLGAHLEQAGETNRLETYRLFWRAVLTVVPTETLDARTFVALSANFYGHPSAMHPWLRCWMESGLPLPSPQAHPEALAVALACNHWQLADRYLRHGYDLQTSHALAQRDGARWHARRIPAGGQDELTYVLWNRYGTGWLLKWLSDGRVSLPAPLLPDLAFWTANPYLLTLLWGQSPLGEQAEAANWCSRLGLHGLALEAGEYLPVVTAALNDEQFMEFPLRELRDAWVSGDAMIGYLMVRPQVTHTHASQLWEAALSSGEMERAAMLASLCIAPAAPRDAAQVLARFPSCLKERPFRIYFTKETRIAAIRQLRIYAKLPETEGMSTHSGHSA